MTMIVLVSSCINIIVNYGGVEIFPKRVQADATRAHTSWETFITHIEYASIGLGN